VLKRAIRAIADQRDDDQDVAAVAAYRPSLGNRAQGRCVRRRAPSSWNPGGRNSEPCVIVNQHFTELLAVGAEVQSGSVLPVLALDPARVWAIVTDVMDVGTFRAVERTDPSHVVLRGRGPRGR
jgi:hypothetical protein